MKVHRMQANLKIFSVCFRSTPVATPETIELFRLVARRWAGAPYDIIRSAIPPRVASVDKEEFLKPAEPEENHCSIHLLR